MDGRYRRDSKKRGYLRALDDESMEVDERVNVAGQKIFAVVLCTAIGIHLESGGLFRGMANMTGHSPCRNTQTTPRFVYHRKAKLM